jgi:Immunity protein 51
MTTPSADDATAFAPGKLVQHDSNYSIIFDDFPACDAFEEHGIEGGGYTWHGLVVHVLEQDAPAALEHLKFDCEAGMFCAYGQDLGALAAVGRALAKLQDSQLLARLAATVDLSEYD